MAKTLVGALRVTLGLDSVEFERGATRAQAAARRLGQNLQRIGAAMSLVGAGVALAIRGQLNAADQMGDIAQRMGVPVEQLSLLQHAAEMSGMTLEELGTGLQQLARNMVRSEEKFTSLGVAVRDANGEMRPTSDVLTDLAAVFADMPDGADKVALAMSLMGRSGAAMIPLLNQGAGGLRALTDEARAMGLVITQETHEAAARFNDNLDRLGKTMTGLVRVITANLAPVLAQISDVVVRAAAAFQNLSPEMQKVISVVAGLTVVIGPALVALGLMVTAIAAISAPALATAAAIAAVTAALAVVGSNVPVLQFFRDLLFIMQNLSTAANILAGDLAKVFGLGQQVDEKGLPGVVVPHPTNSDPAARGFETGQAVADGLVQGVGQTLEARKAELEAYFRNIPKTANEVLQIQSPSRVFAEIGHFIAEGLGLGIQSGQGMVGAAVQGLADTAGRAAKGFQTVGDQMTSMFTSAFSSIVTGSQSAGDAISGLLRQLADMAANAAFKGLFGGLFKSGGILDGLIPGLATGTSHAAAGLTMVGEQGPELVAFGGGERVFNAGQTARMLNQGPAAPEVKFSNINVLDPSIVGQFMATPEGRRATVNVLRMEGLLGA